MDDSEKDRDRYCTPPPIKTRLVDQLGGLADLDPCYDPTGLMLARLTYDIRRGQNGLNLRWHGHVWVNMPYSKPGPWLERAARHYWAGLVDSVTCIVNVQPGSRYWHRWVWGTATAVCFLEGRVAFLYDGVPEQGNRHDQAVIYYGDDLAAFRRAWEGAGAIVHPARPRLTAKSRRPRMMRMDTPQHDEPAPEPFDLMRVLAAPLIFTAYSRIKHMTVEEVVEGVMPTLADFMEGFQIGRMMEAAPEEVTFDDGIPPQDPEPEPVTTAPRKRAKKAAKKKAKKATKKAAKKKAAANGKAPTGSTAELDDHVEALLQSQDGMVQSRDLLPLLNGVNENRLRKSLARLVEQGRAASSGRTKSKQYQATHPAA